MALSLRQVAERFGVAEPQIVSWVHDEHLPRALASDQYRFHRADLLERLALRRYDPGIAVPFPLRPGDSEGAGAVREAVLLEAASETSRTRQTGRR